MMKFISFEKESGDKNIQIVNHSSYLPDVLAAFTSFLRGAGFTIDGTLEVVEDEDFNMDDKDVADEAEDWDWEKDITKEEEFQHSFFPEIPDEIT